MAYPDDKLVPNTYYNKGESKTETSHAITANQVILETYARGRRVNTDGNVISSSISVTRGGEAFTEVFQTPVPDGNYFYHFTDTATEKSSILLFNANQTQPVNVTYETAGSTIDATRATEIETEISSIETALGLGILGMQSGVLTGNGSAQAISTPTASPTGSIIVILTRDDGGTTPSFSFAALNTAVNLAGWSGGVNLHYLLILKQ